MMVKNEDGDHTPIFGSRDINKDYLTLKGIELKTGHNKEDLYTHAIPGELLDNGIDYQETHNVINPHVYFEVSNDESVFKITVRNNVNPDSNHVFTKELLESNYNFNKYHSSKRIFRINRGALGDASKMILGAPYALADSMNIKPVEIPIIHKTSSKNVLKTFDVKLSADNILEITEHTEQSNENYTEVCISLPFYHAMSYGEILHFLLKYISVNTHISFTFNISGIQMVFPATQPIINNGKNLTSVHYYNLSEFRQVIREFQHNDKTTYEVLKETFREASILPKNDLTNTPTNLLNNTEIEQIFKLLRKMLPITEDKGIGALIAFNTNKTTRRKALEERLKQQDKFCKFTKYKQKYGYYKSEDGEVKYPYFFEILIGKCESLMGNLQVIQSINSKVSTNNLVYGGPYEYNIKEKEESWDYRPASSIYDIFAHYKYAHDDKIGKKKHSIIIVNLISPRISYESHGKAKLDHLPFAEVIAHTIEEACKGGNDRGDKRPRTEILEDVLLEEKNTILHYHKIL